ncbi:MAG: ribonuclease P protein component 4 [Nanoarchaeota archaeon]
MLKRYSSKSNNVLRIANARINFLFKIAKEEFNKDSNLSDKYVKLARKIAMKFKIRLPSNLKKSFCKHCHKYLVPSVNCRVRIHKHRIIYYCLSCRNYMRHPIK